MGQESGCKTILVAVDFGAQGWERQKVGDKANVSTLG